MLFFLLLARRCFHRLAGSPASSQKRDVLKLRFKYN